MDAALRSNPDKWLSLPVLCDFIHTGVFKPWDVGYTLSPAALSNMYILNTLTGEAILPNTQGSEIDLELLRASAAALYGLGAAELALDRRDECPDSPCAQVMQIRLTPLGRYAFGIDKEYHTEATESVKYFEADDEHLIIRSLSRPNPYESLLLDTAIPIGGGKYAMNSESFLKNCSSSADVEEKVKFFEEYICENPPAVWRDFFKTIRQRCDPLLPIQENYMLLQLNPEDKELAALVTGNEALRSLVIMAEGYRILVRSKDYPQLCKLLKVHGYLI